MICKYNQAIECSRIRLQNQPCIRCGFNPAVDKQRRKKIPSVVKIHATLPKDGTQTVGMLLKGGV